MRVGKPVFFIITAIALLLAYLAFFGLNFYAGTNEIVINGANNMKFGIDIKGGIEAYYVPEGDITPTADQLDQAKTVFENRLDSLGYLDREITVNQQTGTLLIRFPFSSSGSIEDPQDTVTALGQTAQLTFRDPDGNDFLDGSHVKHAGTSYDTEQGHFVTLEFDEEGTKIFADKTTELKEKIISIYMDDNEISSATVREAITDGNAIISGGNFTAASAKYLADQINAGSLPFSLVSKSYSTISPTLGQGSLNVMVYAGIIAFIIICLFLIFYYRLPGLVASVAILAQTALQILALSIPQFSLTLPGIAGIILSVGIGVDANVIISERIREELREGKTLSGAVDEGFKRALSTVVDGNATSVIVAVLLMVFGSGSMWSFGYTLLTGIIFNFITGVISSRLMIRSLASIPSLRKPFLFGDRRKKADV